MPTLSLSSKHKDRILPVRPNPGSCRLSKREDCLRNCSSWPSLNSVRAAITPGSGLQGSIAQSLDGYRMLSSITLTGTLSLVFRRQWHHTVFGHKDAPTHIVKSALLCVYYSIAKANGPLGKVRLSFVFDEPVTFQKQLVDGRQYGNVCPSTVNWRFVSPSMGKSVLLAAERV